MLVVLDLDRPARFWGFISDHFCVCWAVNTRRAPLSWLWNIPTGWPKRDPEDGMLDNSIAGLLWNVETAVHRRQFDADRQCEVARIPLTPEQTRHVSPEWADLHEEEQS